MDELIVEMRGAVTIATLNRPERHNALNSSLLARLGETVKEFGADDDQRVLVISGSGDKAFSAGADLKNLGGEDGRGRRLPMSRQPDIAGIAACPKPTIAALNGFAVGGGLEIALCCDIRLAVEGAWIALPEPGRGFLAGLACVVLPRLMSFGTVMDLMLAGERMSAADAERLGLVQKIVPDREQLLAEALRKAELMGSHSPAALMGTKQVLRFARDRMIGEHQALHDAVINRVFLSGDAIEGIDAFREKREPRFSAGWPDPLEKVKDRDGAARRG